jgi:hypothetical protein
MTAKRDGDFRQGAMAAAASDRMVASDYLTRAENLLAGQASRSVENNRPHVARVLRVSEATCSNIRRGRRQIIPAWLKENIISLFIHAAEAELRAIENEIDVARQIGLGNGDSKLVEARARAANLVRVLEAVNSEGAGELAQ